MISARPLTILACFLGGMAVLLDGSVSSRGADAPAPTSAALPLAPGLVPPGGTPTALQLRVRNPAEPLPADCGLDEGYAIVAGFIDAFNRGDQDALPAFFPAVAARGESEAVGKFHWFAVVGSFIAYDREELLPYLAERHAHGERLQLLQLKVGESWQPDSLGMLFDVLRRADDIPSHVAGGKGSLHCPTRTIMVWNLSDQESLGDFVHPPPRPTCPTDKPNCE